jgi:hypothetical protein
MAPDNSWSLILFFSVITVSVWLQKGGANKHAIDSPQFLLPKCAVENIIAKS